MFPTQGLPAQGDRRSFDPRTVELYQTVDFAALVPPAQLTDLASPHDLVAVASFTNAATGDSFVTEGFFDGGADGMALYRFRFTPTSLGRWTLSTASPAPALDGLTGTVDAVEASDPGRLGFLVGDGGRVAAPTAGDRRVAGVAFQVFMHGGSPFEDLGRLPRSEPDLSLALTALLDEAAAAGFDAVFVGVWQQWFELGASRSDRHDSVEPDPATFRVLETLLALAHARGMLVHLWQWGDEQRLWSPLGIPADVRVPGDVGGVGGVADVRLQRAIAARLGPLPNWTMGYGFDLFEWADEEAVLAWAAELAARMARPHLLTAIEQRRSATRLFSFAAVGSRGLPLVSDGTGGQGAAEAIAAGTGEAVSAVARAAAASALQRAGGRPVIFENRFLFDPGGTWTMDATRRAMWGFTLGGGVAAVWGVDWDLQAPYPAPEQLVTFARAWRGRLTGDLVSTVLADGSLALLRQDGAGGVVFREDAAALELPPMAAGTVVWAVDTEAAYAPLRVELDAARAGDAAPPPWRAPYVSDWALLFDPPALP